MGKTFLTATANYEDFSTIASKEINGHVLKNNDSGLKKAFTFFQGDNKILILSGFAGVGKKQVAEHTLSYLDKGSVILRFVCTESTKLDDIHLSFFKTLKQKTSIKDTSELDAITNINDKIDYIFSKLDLNFIPVLYNFDSIKEDNRTDVVNYILNLAQRDNIKSLLTATVFDTELIPENIKYTKVMIKALSKEIFETYLRDYGIKVTPAMLDQLYRLSRGYFFSVCIAVKIMINQELSMNDFIVQYTNSGLKFDDFLSKTYYRLIVGTTKSAFNLFVKLHHGLNLKILQTIGSYPEVILKTLSENFYINKKGDLYYPSEFLKSQLEESIGDEISNKRLVSYYEKQAELPPEERDFSISRPSLQALIAHYSGVDITPEQEVATNSQDSNTQQETTEEKNVKLDLENLSTNELVNKAIEFFNTFDYISTIEVLTAVLSKKEELLGSNMLYTVYGMLAQTYAKLNKWQYALYYYEVLENHFKILGKQDSIDMVQYEKANIYYLSYRIIDSIKILKSLTNTSKNNSVLSQSYILLGNIALTASNKELALQYYKDGIKFIDDKTEKSVKLELFFKYAILSDETNDINNAIEFYQKCIEINDEKSKYRALAYSNLADLFYDNELFEEAKECFEKAYVSDKENDNDYGMYYSLSKLIELSDKKDKENLLKMALESKQHALKTQDFNAIVDSTIKLGDVYYDYPEPEKALTEYLELYKMDKEDLSEYNLKMVKSRLEDIRARLGKEKFEELVPDYE